MRRPFVSSLVLLAFWTFPGCRGALPRDALTRAAFEGRTADVLALLDRAGVDACDPLVWAARGGRPGTILAITARGVNPDACHAGVNGWTALMHAIHKDQPAAVQALLRGGASANPPAGAHRLTPLMLATGNGNLTIVNMLLKAGADPRATTANGLNALTVALTGGP